jgi:hypothetical protein
VISLEEAAELIKNVVKEYGPDLDKNHRVVILDGLYCIEKWGKIITTG